MDCIAFTCLAGVTLVCALAVVTLRNNHVDAGIDHRDADTA